MHDISIVVTVLTAMITPAILIVACGSLSLTTSQRLSRSIERTRKLTAEFREISAGNKAIPKNEKLMLFGQLQMSAKRAVLLQRAMTLLYIALGFFIATSLLIGVFEIWEWGRSWILIVLPMLGALSLLMASIILIMETRMALRAVDEEMNFRLSASLYYYQEEEDEDESDQGG